MMIIIVVEGILRPRNPRERKTLHLKNASVCKKQWFSKSWFFDGGWGGRLLQKLTGNKSFPEPLDLSSRGSVVWIPIKNRAFVSVILPVASLQSLPMVIKALLSPELSSTQICDSNSRSLTHLINEVWVTPSRPTAPFLVVERRQSCTSTFWASTSSQLHLATSVWNPHQDHIFPTTITLKSLWVASFAIRNFLSQILATWSPSHILSCPLIGALFACPDRRGDRDVWSGRGDRPSRPQRERWSGGWLICIGRPHFDLRNLNGQIGTSFGNLLAWLAEPCSRFPNSIFFGDFFRFGHFNLVCYEEFLRETGLIGQEWSGWSGKVSQVWGWKQISLIVIGSVQIRGSWSADRGAIGQIRDN